MCELLGMNSKLPTDICFSFKGFQARGGGTSVHADGWGIAFFEGRGLRTFHDPNPSCQSPIAQLLSAYPIRSTNVVAHIRKATQGGTSLENTHPFQRELWGRHWVFAHNGTLSGYAPPLSGRFLPVGSTDSELAFCWILQHLHDEFGNHPPDRAVLFERLRQSAIELAGYGAINFILSNGDCLYAHCSTNLNYLVRQAPFARAHLKDEDISMDFAAVLSPDHRTVVIATTPLTDNEQWIRIPAGSLWCFENGEIISRADTVAGTNHPLTGNSACGTL